MTKDERIGRAVAEAVGEAPKHKRGMTPKVYLAGPMSGIPNFNFPAFDKAAEELREFGLDVFNPADADREHGEQPDPEGKPPEHLSYYMARDLQPVAEAVMAVFLPGWRKSRGATLEYNVARSLDIPCYRYGSWTRIESNVGDDFYEVPVEKSHPILLGDDSKATNPKDLVGSAKLPLHLWPETATIYGSLGLLDGMLKYGRSNWREAGVRYSIYHDAVKRHLNAAWEGEDIDAVEDGGSGLPHLAHALACLAILVDAKATGKLVDDRAFNGKGYRATVEEMTPHVERLKAKHADRDPKHYTIADNREEQQ